ncbi:putative reverse transcriptase domain-containing protein, partial [Tanacetum coccineum]
MVDARGSTPKFLGPAFKVAVQRSVHALLPGLTIRLTNEILQNGAGGSGDQPPTIHTWLERFGKQKHRSLGWQVTSWKKILSIGGRLLNKPNEVRRMWLPCHRRISVTSSFCSTFPGPPEEQAKHFKWALCDWILDGIMNTEFTDVAQVANAARNIEILHKRSSQNNKRNHDGDRIRPTAQGSNQRGYDQKRYDGRGYDRQGGNSNQEPWQNRGQQYNRSSGSSGHKGYPDYASSPPCDTCGKLHPGKACYRATRACFTCGSTGHMARDCHKNGGNGGTISGTLFLNGRAVFALFDTGATHSVVSVSFAKHISISPTLLNYTLSISTTMKSLVIIDHEYQNCPLRFDDKIRSANLFPLDMNDFDINLGMDWLTEHRATINLQEEEGGVVIGDSGSVFLSLGVLVLVILSILDSL